MGRKCWCVLGMTLCLLPSLGCGGKTRQALNYNEAMVKVDKEMQNVYETFTKGIQQSRGNVAKAKELHSKAVPDMASVLQKAKALEVPDVPQGKRCNRRFLST